jgi:hypothetical protein
MPTTYLNNDTVESEPAIIDESTRSKLNQSLNLLNPVNGFGNNTLANYTTKFRRICESYSGEFGNTLVSVYNHMGQWLFRRDAFVRRGFATELISMLRV